MREAARTGFRCASGNGLMRSSFSSRNSFSRSGSPFASVRICNEFRCAELVENRLLAMF